MTAPVRFPRFFVTSPAPCPYLPGRSERKVFTELKGAHAEALNDALSRIGFRRSQNVAYRPSCLDCHACVSVRVVADEFDPSSTQKRNLKRNSDLVATLRKPWATPEWPPTCTLCGLRPVRNAARLAEQIGVVW